MRKIIEKRLIELALNIDDLCKALQRSYLSQHLTTQIIRSSTSAALNYGESQASESKRDFIHKISLALKELRETKICLKLIHKSVHENKLELFNKCQDECDQLVAILYKTIKSTQKGMNR
jgi:four helix bundle protein